MNALDELEHNVTVAAAALHRAKELTREAQKEEADAYAALDAAKARLVDARRQAPAK